MEKEENTKEAEERKEKEKGKVPVKAQGLPGKQPLRASSRQKVTSHEDFETKMASSAMTASRAFTLEDIHHAESKGQL